MLRRYVVTGREGQVVSALLERAKHWPEIEVLPLGRPLLDLSSHQTINKAISAAKPDIIISVAAYTAVDQAETDEAVAFSVNADAVGHIGEVAADLGVPVVHISTDYVFDGEKNAPYNEDDPVRPLGVYGRSKLEGEKLLAGATSNYAILRTAWVYSPFGKNFVRTMLRLAETRDTIGVVADQYGNPTSALEIADGVLKVADNLLSSNDEILRGTFHMSGSGDASWADFAHTIFQLSGEVGGPLAAVNSITTAEYPTPARRPMNSRLDCDKLYNVHGVRLPHWKMSAAEVVSKILNS
ncbi:dTDP-4-dehydrorhamnose reductase [Rhizobium sp. Root483D2]|uniref:dTDP-4-dehydrorhamnose reductase n=1 Tax=Rhizobium sp. Root483D2 TaxID=1736545 RepID=UPI000712EBBE|nr:dTDP-4-dehydrorhamnose reductase [Rhizobium sp. Root483D2]KQY45712.1 dTDP-4-dehydrorhamnose reductase [Rhizobium sp. Root483D2]